MYSLSLLDCLVTVCLTLTVHIGLFSFSLNLAIGELSLVPHRLHETDYATGLNILLVEDDLDTAEFISKGLQQHGEIVQHCDNAEQAMLLASSSEFDVIIFDRLLPNMDGLDAVRILRASKVTIPIIMLTALSDTSD